MPNFDQSAHEDEARERVRKLRYEEWGDYGHDNCMACIAARNHIAQMAREINDGYEGDHLP